MSVKEEVTILYEDNHLIAVNKPFGMLSQGDATGDLCIVDWAKEYIRRSRDKPGNVYLGLLHRLDRPAGGVLLLARTSKAASRMSKAFQKKEIQKRYLAITEGIPQPKAGQLRHYIQKLEGRNIVRAHTRPTPDSKEALLSYRVLGIQGSRALVEVDLQTGRRHQIRAQFASLDCPLLGDLKYGHAKALPDKSITLLARELVFDHPVKKIPLRIVAPIPDTDAWRDFIRFVPQIRTGLLAAENENHEKR